VITTDISGKQQWLQSLAGLVSVPAPYRSLNQDRAAARATLRCDDQTLSMLVQEGLPCEGPGGAERFDPYDVYNLGLYSGSRRSLPEFAALFVSRMAQADPASWTTAAGWQIQLTARCQAPPDARSCCEDGRWAVMRPTPETYGGLVQHTQADASLAVTPLALEITAPDGQIDIGWRMCTAGARYQLHSPVLREMMHWVLSDFRFQSVPPALAESPDELRQLRIADCIGGSILMEGECRRLGIPARTQRTMMLGVATFLCHGRLECTDDDGVSKALDSGLCAAARLSPSRVDAFDEFCHGSTSNRIIPLTGSFQTPFVRHGDNVRYPASLSTRVSREELTR
jgi:hypothetical protein